MKKNRLFPRVPVIQLTLLWSLFGMVVIVCIPFILQASQNQLSDSEPIQIRMTPPGQAGGLLDVNPSQIPLSFSPELINPRMQRFFFEP